MIPSDRTPMPIRMVDVVKRFGDATAVRDLNLEINHGELMVVLGPSGSGKTTTLNLLAGLETPTAGQIYFGDRAVTDVPTEQRDIAMVFQSVTLYPHLNVRENIVFGLKLAKVPAAIQEQRLLETTRLLGIDRFLNRRIHALSGGERQRVAIAKALVKRPELFILDEPFASLDAELRRELRGEIVRIHRELQTTMLFVTHDQEEALAIADRIALMDGGRLVQLGPALELYEKPSTKWVASFVGPYRINLLEGELRPETRSFQTTAGTLTVDQDVFTAITARAPTSRMVLGVRPEFTSLVTSDGAASSLPVEVYTRQHLGNEVLYTLKAGPTTLRSVSPVTRGIAIGDHARLEIEWPRALWFDAGSGLLVDPNA